MNRASGGEWVEENQKYSAPEDTKYAATTNEEQDKICCGNRKCGGYPRQSVHRDISVGSGWAVQYLRKASPESCPMSCLNIEMIGAAQAKPHDQESSGR